MPGCQILVEGFYDGVVEPDDADHADMEVGCLTASRLAGRGCQGAAPACLPARGLAAGRMCAARRAPLSRASQGWAASGAARSGCGLCNQISKRIKPRARARRRRSPTTWRGSRRRSASRATWGRQDAARSSGGARAGPALGQPARGGDGRVRGEGAWARVRRPLATLLACVRARGGASGSATRPRLRPSPIPRRPCLTPCLVVTP